MPQQRRRNRFIIGILSLGLLAGAVLTASPAQAVDALGPYYAEPAWDRKLPATTRFVVLTNWGSEAVLDKETGLVWERSPALTLHTWAEARSACTARTTGNRKGWRLPSIHELQSLIHPLNFDPALPAGHPFLTVQSAFYWSATTNAENPSSALGVHFINANEAYTDKTASSALAWCVRGGMNAAAY